MSWIDTVLNILFPPPVSLKAFDALPPPTAHSYEPWILAATKYQSDAKRITKYIKETPDTNYIHRCAKLMAQTLEAALLEDIYFLHDRQKIILVPVPQHRSTTKTRGFSTSDMLAHHLQQLLPYTHVAPLLKKDKKTEKQALLPKHKRLTNQSGAFSFIDKHIRTNNVIVLVDDISTTGSTLRECRKVLVSHGFKNSIALVFAH